jgi:formate-dependent phosphoribosylglycinamide formyltransferase (GAR transformylase)
MSISPQKTLLCITSYEKGQEFIRECKRQGAYVILLTVTDLEHASWPRESIDEVFYMFDLSKTGDVISVVSFLARTRAIDIIVALDDYDVWTAANLREHLRIPGMGDTTVRHFRDKLAMRLKAQENNIPVPEFVHVLNYNKVSEFIDRVPLPWVLKPRAEASTIGIAKINTIDEFWSRVETLSDRQSFFLLERFIPGEVYHVDSLIVDREIVFAEAHHYGKPPLDVYHEGGIFTTRTIPRASADETLLKELNRQIISAFGLVRGVAHTEFIKAYNDGHFYFLETAARVGGANIAEMVEASTDINLWREWAKIELNSQAATYQLPEQKQNYAGVIVSLARQEYPDTSAYQDPEIVMRLDKRHHVGFVIASHSSDRVNFLLDEYTQRFINDFLATLPPSETRPPSSGT